VIRALLIDMDDTLYDERDYVLSGFRAVAEAVAGQNPGVDPEAFYADMVAELAAHGRGRVFDAALVRAGIPPEPLRISELVEAYRAHKPTLSLWPGVAETLEGLRRDYRLAVITDGLGVMQQNKAVALALGERVDEVVYCWEQQAPKPDPKCYHQALRALDTDADEAVVIGDRPDHDMAAAAAVGCRSIRVRTGRYAAADSMGFDADATVADFTQTPAVLRGWCSGARR
jgi:putative hydrolase of the HAD superfamily